MLLGASIEENRELGYNPKRTHHCDAESRVTATDYIGKAHCDNDAQPGDLPE
jgi:hypothetical protein